jgi:glutaminyl-peptide cyclotransferase
MGRVTARFASLVLVGTGLCAGGPSARGDDAQAAERLTAQVVRAYPHDRGAFTQGLVWRDGALYESTGMVGQSSLRRIDLATGAVLQKADVPPPYFAEGLADAGNRLYQLTWQHGRVFVYDKSTFGRVGGMSYQGEGWGLCHDGRAFVMSDGSDTLTVRRTADFVAERTVRVTLDARPLSRLNELECVGGDVYANVWQTETIVRIDVRSGRVTAQIDASGLLTPAERQGVDVLNGIAYDPGDRTFLITGKWWPKLFRVRF